MPIFPFRCDKCGWIEEELVLSSEEAPDMPCPMKCQNPTWTKRTEMVVIAPPDRLKSDNERFPHRTHMREPCVHMTKNGPELGTRPIIAKSRRHMEQLMEQHGFVYYEEPANGGSQGISPEMPEDLKVWGQHPSVLKYKDLVKQGRVPKQMVLTESELKERFHA